MVFESDGDEKICKGCGRFQYACEAGTDWLHRESDPPCVVCDDCGERHPAEELCEARLEASRVKVLRAAREWIHGLSAGKDLPEEQHWIPETGWVL